MYMGICTSNLYTEIGIFRRESWKIPWMEDPVRLQSMGLQRVGHGWVTSLQERIHRNDLLPSFFVYTEKCL